MLGILLLTALAAGQADAGYEPDPEPAGPCGAQWVASVQAARALKAGIERRDGPALFELQEMKFAADDALGTCYQQQLALRNAEAERREKAEKAARYAAFQAFARKNARAALSWIICHNTRVRAGAKKEIATELKYAREGGGVVDEVKIHDNQDEMRGIDEANEKFRDRLKALRLKPLACGRSDETLPDALAGAIPATDEDHYITPDEAPWFW